MRRHPSVRARSIRTRSVFLVSNHARLVATSALVGAALMAFRDADLTVHRNRRPGKLLHHDISVISNIKLEILCIY